MKFRIVEWDNDYHVPVDEKVMEFPNKKEANEYCYKESWTGYSYYAYKIKDRETHPGDALTYR